MKLYRQSSRNRVHRPSCLTGAHRHVHRSSQWIAQRESTPFARVQHEHKALWDYNETFQSAFVSPVKCFRFAPYRRRRALDRGAAVAARVIEASPALAYRVPRSPSDTRPCHVPEAIDSSRGRPNYSASRSVVRAPSRGVGRPRGRDPGPLRESRARSASCEGRQDVSVRCGRGARVTPMSRGGPITKIVLNLSA
ncbi:hypothetical protein EVAR_17855_1 [Eumeta japonica]|uniref:Uncharacterized protein n=1 Tax=Eumeta variegata TaxID=151549 RepID=A0A4C1TTM8_EUMVA|nr:hypothetical protein EVAR_17855_1 [Eumeta japonica]